MYIQFVDINLGNFCISIADDNWSGSDLRVSVFTSCPHHNGCMVGLTILVRIQGHYYSS